MGIDYAQFIKVYGADSESERRYSPVVCQSCSVRDPGRTGPEADLNQLSRAGRTWRCGCRCGYARLTNAFSTTEVRS